MAEQKVQGIALRNVEEVTFEVRGRAGVWTLHKEGGFYGDFLKEEHALAAAHCAVAAILAAGGAAQLWVTSRARFGRAERVLVATSNLWVARNRAATQSSSVMTLHGRGYDKGIAGWA